MSRGRKSAVTLEKAREWLRLVEELGQPVSRIAKEENFSSRTVLRATERAREDRDQRAARQEFFKDQLRGHQEDLCQFARRVRSEFENRGPGPVFSTLKSDALWEALRRHIPQALLWREIEAWERLGPALDGAAEGLKQRIVAETVKATGIGLAATADAPGLQSDFVDGPFFHLRSVVYGGQGLSRANMAEEEHQDGVRLRHGAYRLAVVSQTEKENFLKAYFGLLNDALSWPDYAKLKTLVEQEKKLRDSLKASLTGIVLRHVVPGKCSYCPF
jgi:hypothetical protein